MKSKTIDGLRLFYDPTEQETARIIEEACERIIPIMRQRWDLETPQECRVYVMTSWTQVLFHSAPGLWKGYLALILPLLAWRVGSIWPHAGGWTFSYGRRVVVGIKPPYLIHSDAPSFGDQFFLPYRDAGEKVQAATCHELSHAFTLHLKLPAWLNEGLATLSTEYYLERRIIREDTLKKLTSHSQDARPDDAGKLRLDKPQLLFFQYVRGYWLTRYIEDTKPELLKALLAKRWDPKELEEMVASAFGKDSGSFWQEINSEIIARFR